MAAAHPNARHIANIRYPHLLQVIPPENIYSLLVKARDTVDKITFSMTLLQRPEPGRCFVERRMTAAPYVDGYVWRGPVQQGMISVGPDEKLEVTRVGGGASAQLDDQQREMCRLEYRLLSGMPNLYFVHYIAAPGAGGREPVRPAAVRPVPAVAEMAASGRARPAAKKLPLGQTMSEDVPEIAIDECDGLTPFELAYKRQSFIRHVMGLLFSSVEPVSVEAFANVEPVLTAQIATLGTETERLGQYRSTLCAALDGRRAQLNSLWDKAEVSTDLEALWEE